MNVRAPDTPGARRPSVSRAPRRPWSGLAGAPAAVVLMVLAGVVAEVGAAAAWWAPDVLPAPSDLLPAAARIAGSPRFWQDALRTGAELLLSCVFGVVAGLGLGVAFWKAPGAGRVFEPYLVSFYAVPLVLFYPIAIVLIGINQWSVVVLASIMTAIPMTLNTWTGLRAIPPVYLRLAASIGCSRSQTLFRVALPAAAPYVVAGLRLGVAYALIGTVAMEFTTAQAGLGYQVRYLYESFDAVGMYAYILVIVAVSVLLTAVLEIAERLLPRGRDT
ncbi:ABC transporter permease [Bailinhaonella thermotolerans]|uniref:ABC transporter permease n=1 Tax=Bailinhaonella thermotolerans TaxID=1070861 RepID=A0A3A4BW66_9ACTN|nr:ABC transporter permease [Bailinhaonella thermotolerans]RJL35838.1 ABC transporter permease [Bailinhaonella thermotolerans]